MSRFGPAALLLLTSAALSAAEIETVTLPSSSPLVTFRILFKTGAASDSAGKQGVAALTAAMLSQTAQEAALQATQLSRTWGKAP